MNVKWNVVDRQMWVRRSRIYLRQDHMLLSWSNVLFQQNVVDLNFTTNLNELHKMQGKSMTEDAQMMTIDSKFIVQLFSQNYNFESLVLLDSAWTVTFFHRPFCTLESISHNCFLIRSNAHMKNDVLQWVCRWRIDKVYCASKIRLMTQWIRKINQKVISNLPAPLILPLILIIRLGRSPPGIWPTNGTLGL